MARTTGVILAIGAVTVVNETIFLKQDIDWRVPIATGFAAGAFALMERGWEAGAVGLAWLALVATMFVRIKPGQPTPVETALAYWEGTR